MNWTVQCQHVSVPVYEHSPARLITISWQNVASMTPTGGPVVPEISHTDQPATDRDYLLEMGALKVL